MDINKEKMSELVHTLKHDFGVEIASTITFNDYIIEDINSGNTKDVIKNLHILNNNLIKMNSILQGLIKNIYD